ncbi:MAG: taurine dioxygenase [Alphaproteobacteria bacterium]|nr:taurine dioxygenase [Alphaproteobacteria bacterium]
MSYSTITVNKIAGACGAEIEGADLSKPLSNAQFADIHRAFLDNGVIFFRDQNLDFDAQKAFARRFGTLILDPFVIAPPGHPEVMVVTKEPWEKKNFANMWHTDATFLERPPLGSFLYAVEVPPHGGDTMWANQYLAYEALSPGMKTMLDGMKAVHTALSYNQEIDAGQYNATRSMKLRFDDVMAKASTGQVEHPVVRTHPETGRKALYVHSAYTERFADWTEAESKALLEYLYAFCTRPEFTCRFRWTKGSLALWDNRCVQHYPINDYQGFRRVMHRVTAEGDRPI